MERGGGLLLRYSSTPGPGVHSCCWQKRMHFRKWITAALFVSCLVALATPPTAGCPFCKVRVQTLGERMALSDVAVMAKLAAASAPAGHGQDAGQPDEQATFSILRVLKGEAILGDVDEITTYYFGESQPGSTFLLLGTDETQLIWAVPVPMSKRAKQYIETSLELPQEGRKRLAFFHDYLEDQEPLLAWDAYEEFGRAPYSVVEDLKSSMDRDRLLAWIQNPKVPTDRRRLYLTMLGVCGMSSDAPVLEKMLRTDGGEPRTTLDAMIACYLKLKGPDGLPLVEDLFLKNQDAEFADSYAAVTALRFMEGQTDAISRDRIIESFHLMLDRPELADLVVADLARWEDWSVMPQLVELFKNADDDTSWLRQPIARYLMQCPLPEAQQHLEELRKIDAEAIEQASSVQALLAGRARGSDANTDQRGASDVDQDPAVEGEQNEPAADEQGEGTAAQSVETKERSKPPNALSLLGIMLLTCAILFGVMWLVLGGPGMRRISF